MKNHNLELPDIPTKSSQDNTLHRMERLAKVCRIVCELSGLTQAQLAYLISSLDDQKGILIVTWMDKPTQRGKDWFATAWRLCGEDRIQHVTEG